MNIYRKAEDKHCKVCDICGNEIGLYDSHWMNNIQYHCTFINEIDDKPYNYSGSCIDVCPICYKKGKKIRENLQDLYKKYDEDCMELIGEWKKIMEMKT